MTMATNKAGEFTRPDSIFRKWLGSEEHPYEAGRYRLYVAMACPWANRALITKKLLGIDDVELPYTVVNPAWEATRPGEGFFTEKHPNGHFGWVFATTVTPVGAQDKPEEVRHVVTSKRTPKDGKEPVHGFGTVRELYEHSKDELKYYTVPLIFDTKNDVIVNNESSEIIIMLNNWRKHVKKGEEQLDLYPPHLQKEIDAMNDANYNSVNNGVYRCGFAVSQSAYTEANADLLAAMNRLEAHLGGGKGRPGEHVLLEDADGSNASAIGGGGKKLHFLVGDQLTLADIRLFVTLIRMDEVYVSYFKCQNASLYKFPNVFRYVANLTFKLEELLKTSPGGKKVANPKAFHEATDMYEICHHYFCSHKTLNTYSIVPEPFGILEDMEKRASV